MPTSIVVRTGGRSLSRCSHTVQVVLTDKQTGQLPEGGHVESFKHLSLVGRTVPIESGTDLAGLVVLVGEGYPCTQWHLFDIGKLQKGL